MMFGRGNYGNFGNYRNGFDGCFGYGFMGNGWMMFIIIALIILAIAFTIMLVYNKNKKISKSSALDTLKTKYAQGEITEEEYLRRKDVLTRE